MIDNKVKKELKTGDKIAFYLGSRLLDGTIKEKSDMVKGDIIFLIEADGDLCRVKHRQLHLIYIYK